MTMHLKEAWEIGKSWIEAGVIWGKQPWSGPSLTKKVQGSPVSQPKIGNGCHICSGSVIYAGCTIGDNVFMADHVRVREGASIGDGCTLGPRVSVEYDVVLGPGVKIQHGALIGEKSHVGSKAFIGPGATLICDKGMHTHAVPVNAPTICEGAKIGANTIIMPGVVIGKHAIVGAGSVVTSNVAPDTTVVGNPAKDINRREKPLNPKNMTAYILMSCTVGKELEVAERLLKEYPEIVQIDMCFGEFELIARCELDSYSDLIELVSKRIRGGGNYPDIQATKTLPGKHRLFRKSGRVVTEDCQ